MFAAVLAAVVARGLACSRSTARGPWLAPFGIALGVWVVAGAVSEIANRVQAGRRAAAGRSLAPRSRACRARPTATTLAHFGVGLMVIGIVATSAWQSEGILVDEARRAAPRSPATSLTFRGVAPATRSQLPRGRRPSST